MARTLAVFICVVAAASGARAAGVDKLPATIRGQTLTLAVYTPPAVPRGTIVIGSGDVGWVGLATSIADQFSAAGYLVIGVNVRQYLAAFTSGKAHLGTADVPGDYRAMVDVVRRSRPVPRPIVLAGVSEGAALAVLAASDQSNHEWIDGVITMGLPATAELAWRWTDVRSWITKRDADEPSFAAADFVPSVSPVPLYMIQSRKDEYVPPADYERFNAVARAPKIQILIDAGNHRFTDKRDELGRVFAEGLSWIAGQAR